ncbi:pilus assembly protein, partial [Acinetobacter baumannii]
MKNITEKSLFDVFTQGEFKHEVRQFEKSYDNQQAEQISLM